MPRKPTIRRGPASAYEGTTDVIREVSSSAGGCLISAAVTSDGKELIVSVYSADPTVQVIAPGRRREWAVLYKGNPVSGTPHPDRESAQHWIDINLVPKNRSKYSVGCRWVTETPWEVA